MKASLTASYVQAVKADGGVQVDIYDAHTRGFLLRVSAAGVKSWNIFYRFNGRNRRLTIGRYPDLSLADARKLAHRYLRDVAHGEDPAGAKSDARAVNTFGELAADFMEKHSKLKKRTWAEDQRILNLDILPAWKNRAATDITRVDVRRLLESIVDRGAPIAANRTLALVSSIYNYGVETDVVLVNPAYRIKRLSAERKRDRVLHDAEMAILWKVLESEPPMVAALHRLGLLLAQRRGEILGMTWAELELEAGWWNIPASRTKNKTSHRVPIVGEALHILQSLHSHKIGDFVFPGPHRGEPLHNPQKSIARVRRRCGFDFHFHDLRRSAASGMASTGIQRPIISRLLNHTDRTVTAIYDRYGYLTEMREALTQWDLHVMQLLCPTEDEIVKFAIHG